MGEENSKPQNNDVEVNKNVAALSYVWILCLVPLLGKRDSKFAQFHAKQGLVLFILEIFIMWLPFFGQLAFLIFVLISVMGIAKVLNGEWWKIPYVYEWSKKFNL